MRYNEQEGCLLPVQKNMEKELTFSLYNNIIENVPK